MQQGSPYPNAMAPGWSAMDDATLDAVIMDPAASAAQKAAAAAAKRSRSVSRAVQPTMERVGNDLSGLVESASKADQTVGSIPFVRDLSTLNRMIGRGAVNAVTGTVKGAGRVLAPVADYMLGTSFSGDDATSPVPAGAMPVPEAPVIPNQSPRDYSQPEFGGIFPGMGNPARAEAAAQQAPQRSPTDAAIEAGAAAAQRAMPVAQPQPAAPAASPEADLNFSPGFMELAKKYIDAQDQEAPLTAEDKWLALARAGFGMAASQAPSFGQALGEGAMAGITQLQQVRAQRAEQAARRAQMGLQVAGTEAQLRQGDRNYQLAQQRETREREQGAEKIKTDRLTAEANAKRDEAYIKSLNRGDLSTDDKGNAIIIDRNTGRAKPVLDDSGNPIRATKFASSASARTASTKVGIVRETLRSELGREPTVDEMANGLDKFNRLSPDRKRIALYGVAGKLGIDKNEVADIADYLDQEMDSGATALDAGGEPAAEPATPSGVKSQLPPKEVEKVLANARKAIANGKSKEAVIKRLRDSGIDPSGL